MVKVSIIPTLLTWFVVVVVVVVVVVTSSRTVDHNVGADTINNRRDIDTVRKSTGDNLSINSTMTLYDKTPTFTTNRETISSPNYPTPSKSPENVADLSVDKANRTTDSKFVDRRNFDQTDSADFADGNNDRDDVVNVSSVQSSNETAKIRRALLEFGYERPRLTLADLNGPSISQDAESLADDKPEASKHVRVKRDLGDSNPLDEIRDGEDFTARFEDEEKSRAANNFHGNTAVARPSLKERLTETSNTETVSERRKKRHASELSPEFARVSRNGKKKSRRKSHRRKHRKRPKYRHRHETKMAKFSKGNGIRNGPVNKPSDTVAKLMANKPHGINAVVADQFQLESPVGKRDSADARRSEIEVRKREISRRDEPPSGKSDGDASASKSGEDESRRVKRHESRGEGGGSAAAIEEKNSNRARTRKADESKYYERASDSGKKRAANPGKKTRRETAAKSVAEMKNLMGKLIGKVDELDSYVRERGDKAEREERFKKSDEEKRRTDVEDPEETSNSLTRCVDADFDGMKIKKTDDAKVCVDETGAGDFKSKLETDQRSGGGSGTGGITTQGRKRSAGTTRREDGPEKSRDKRKQTRRKWDRWTEWSSCSVTCGKGRQIRWRHCVHDCALAETEMEEKTCQLPACGPGKFLGIF